MTLTQALGLGVLQGVTEFLPVSSSGHLALARAFTTMPAEPTLLFDVVVHMGTLLAIAWVLRQRLLGIGAALLSWLIRRLPVEANDRHWLTLLILASIPTAILGLTFRGLVGEMHLHPAWVGAALLLNGLLLGLSERMGRRERGAESLGASDAIAIGIAQGLGVLPGISRSGVTVSCGLSRGLRADVAVEFSILLSVPAVLGATLLEVGGAGLAALGEEWKPLCVGFAAAFVTGAFALRALQWVVATRKLTFFALYCAAIGLGAIFLG